MLTAALLPLLVHAGGVEFSDTSYEAAVERAAREDKPVFLDFTASWCRPCRMMDSQVFPDSSLGALVNEHFVAFKVDTQTPEGVQVATKYGISFLPTMIVLDSREQEIKRIKGYRDPVSLILELAPLKEPGATFGPE